INRKRKASSGPTDGLKLRKRGESFQDSNPEKFGIINETKTDEQLILNSEENFDNTTIDDHKGVTLEMETEDEIDIETMIKSCLRNLSKNCLVKVSLVLKGKGIVEPCAMVCLPTKEDLNEYILSWNRKPGEQGEGPTEIMHEDSKAQLRKELKLEHKKMQGTLRRHRKRAAVQAQNSQKENTTQESVSDNIISNKNLEEKYANYNNLMRRAWLMDEDTDLQCCSREIFGYVAHGNFSYSRGRGAAYGWVTLIPLLNAVK
ncbi:unnamed protein product, partial [Meganyctiphanes norvegica]